MSTLVNYRPLDQNLLATLKNREQRYREILADILINGGVIEELDTTSRSGLLQNSEAIYNFSQVKIYQAYDLKDAEILYSQLPKVARLFAIYKIHDKIATVYYYDEDLEEPAERVLSSSDVYIILTEEPVDESTFLLGQGELTTIDGYHRYYYIYMTPDTTIDSNSINVDNLRVELNETKIRYYKYNDQSQSFIEQIVDRESQLGSGVFDKYLDMDNQVIDSDAISAVISVIQNRKSIIAENNNGTPDLTDYDTSEEIVFDKGSLWFIKTVEELETE